MRKKLFYFGLAMASMIYPEKPACGREEAKVSVGVEVAFSGDPQVGRAVAFTERLLSGMEVKTPGTGAWKITVRRTESLAKGGYQLKGTPEGALVEAGDAEGARCGLMALLRRLGVRWYDPSAQPLLPVQAVAPESFEEKRTPSFPYRGLHICGVPHHYDERLVEWMSFQGMNRKLTHVGQLERVGGALKAYGIAPDTTVHSYSEWVPEAKYFEENPEFYALLDGKRVRQTAGGQLCLSSAGMRKVFLHEVRQFLDSHPGMAVIGICPNDGYGWCECEACAKLDAPEDREGGKVNARVADFVEEICAGLAKSHPDVLVGHYSYSNFSDFYRYLRKTPENLMVSVTTFRCYRHAIDEASCPTNQPLFTRLQEIRRRIRHVYVYDYLYYRWGGLPQPQWRVTARDVAAYAKLGLDGYMTETGPASSPDFAAGHLPLYVMAQLLRDRGTDLDALLDDYCQKRFGAAAETMRRYLKRWEDAVTGMEGCLTRKEGDDLERLMPPEMQAEGERLLAGAMEQASGRGKEEVLREAGEFRRWVGVLKQRAEARKVGGVSVGTMEAFRREMEQGEPSGQGALFLDHTLKVIPPDGRTRARFYADAERFGIVVECTEEEMGKVADRPGNALSAVYGSENVEIFLRDGANGKIIYHALASLSGGHCASECEGTRWNWAWDGGYTVKVRRGEGGWTLFFEIALSRINAADTVALTLVRNRHVDGWKKSGIPNGGMFFNSKEYLEIALPKEAP